MAIETGRTRVEAVESGTELERAYEDMKSEKGWRARMLLLSLLGSVPVFGQLVVAGTALTWSADAMAHGPGIGVGECCRGRVGEIFRRAVGAIPTSLLVLLIPIAVFTAGYAIGGSVSPGKPAGLAIPVAGGWFSYGTASWPMTEVSTALMVVGAIMAVPASAIALVAAALPGAGGPIRRARRTTWFVQEHFGELSRIFGITLLLAGLGTVAGCGALLLLSMLIRYLGLPTPALLAAYGACALAISAFVTAPSLIAARAIGFMAASGRVSSDIW